MNFQHDGQPGIMALPRLRPFWVEKKRALADGIFGLTLKPADGQPMFVFRAGQWVMLNLLNQDGSVWAKAPFSIVSAPCESTETLELAIKIYGDFTKRAGELSIGDKVAIQGPYGAFILPGGKEDLVMIAGGIGIAPLRSMIRQTCLGGDLRAMTLFYSSRTRAEMAYEKELREMAAEYANFKPVFVLTREKPTAWDGETGRLSPEIVDRQITDFSRCEFAVCGPGRLMEWVKVFLATRGVDIKKKLHKELF